MKIVGVSACPTGIAHTYMAQEAIEKEGKKRGHDIKIETQGSMGVENELDQAEIDAADIVIFAVSIDIEEKERFDEKVAADKVITIDPGEAIKSTKDLFDRIESL